MTTKLIATQSYPYAGRSLNAGDEFEASEQDAHTLKLIGRAKDAPSLQTRDLKADDPPTAADTTKPKRRYKRRDLQAEE